MQEENQNINSFNLEHKFENRPIAKILFHSNRKGSENSNDTKFSTLTNYSNEITGKFDEDLDSLSDISSFELEKNKIIIIQNDEIIYEYS